MRYGSYGPYKRRMRKNRYKGVYRNGKRWEAKAWRDGTWYRGGMWDTQRLRRGPTVLSRDAIRDICRRALAGEAQQQIARDYGLVPSVVSKIRNGHEHAEVTRDIRQERGWE